MLKKMKPISVFAPITRVDNQERVVEGYAFVNEVVAGEGGVRLKRSAMEAATADYLANGTVRVIHQPIAAGKPLSVEWTERGALLRAKIVDDKEWEKVTEGVYKGFSIGVIPTMMRGKNVEICRWWDTSLVDVGKDPDAKFTCFRSEDPNGEIEVEVERASFAEYLENWAPSSLRDMALDYLWNSLIDIQYSSGDDATPESKADSIRLTCSEFAEFMVGALATGDIPNLNAGDDAETERAITQADVDAFLQRAEFALINRAELVELNGKLDVANEQILALTRGQEETQTELERVQGLQQDAIQRAEAAETRVTELEAQPTRRPPVRVPEAVERTFASEAKSPDTARIAEIRREMDEISKAPRNITTRETDGRIVRYQELKRELATLEA